MKHVWESSQVSWIFWDSMIKDIYIPKPGKNKHLFEQYWENELPKHQNRWKHYIWTHIHVNSVISEIRHLGRWSNTQKIHTLLILFLRVFINIQIFYRAAEVYFGHQHFVHILIQTVDYWSCHNVMFTLQKRL